jgi:hypothetical protein
MDRTHANEAYCEETWDRAMAAPHKHAYKGWQELAVDEDRVVSQAGYMSTMRANSVMAWLAPVL